MTWAPDYITASDLAAFLRVDDTVDNVEFGVWCTAAARAVDRKCNRQFGQLASVAARTYRRAPYWDPQACLYRVDIDDLMDTTGLLVAAVAYASSGATLLPDNAPADGRPYTALGFSSCPTSPLAITARWGWSSVPTQVVAATKLQASRFNARRDSPYGIAGSADTGSELRLLAKLDPDVAVTLSGLSRRRRAG